MEPESKVKAALNQLKRFANLELYTQASSDADKELSGKKPHVTNIENREREEESDSSQPDSDEETKRKITISSVFISQESGNLLRSLIPTKDESRNNDQQQDNNDNGQYIDFEIGILGSLSAGAILLKFGYIFIPSVTLVFTIVTLLIFILRSKEVTLVRSAEETHRVLECVKEHYYPIKSAAAITSCDTCVICLDAFIEGSKVALLPCKHYYHKTCINSWLYSHNTCPICKRDFSKQLEELLSMSTNTTTSSSNSSSDAMTAEQEMSQRTSSRRATTNHTSTVTTTTTSRSPRATRTTTTTSAESGFSISQYLPDLSPLDLTETMVTSSDLSQEEVAMIISAIRAADTAEREETNRGAGSSPAQQHSWQHQQHHHHHPRLYIHSQLRH